MCKNTKDNLKMQTTHCNDKRHHFTNVYMKYMLLVVKNYRAMKTQVENVHLVGMLHSIIHTSSISFMR